MAQIGGTRLLTPTPGATVTITISTEAQHMMARWAAGEAETVNISGSPIDGQTLTMIIANDASLGRVITFGTGLASLGVVTGIVSKKSTVSFRADDGVFVETSRSVGI